MSEALDVLREADLRGSLSPLRRRILAELREPASATVVAGRIGQSRQRVNYHLRELEKAGLVELVETRPRRGRIERIVRATARTVVIVPEVVGEVPVDEQDRFAVETLLATTAQAFGDVAAMRERARDAGKRLVTFTVSAEVGFAEPSDIARFADDLAARVADLAATYDSPQARRRYRVVVGGFPTPNPSEPA
ncbi:winged helix-turn-helix domain-containing protein [Pseudonocardia humida]|uniref:Helix-turn-helix transcriptional regulator n=1 Tax=Pseudonocardia humida TaxID=2800819 RepID=A0ABT1A692_9PSEU|nr:helix-turn-helix domain-containing protein [Pseudonocardia humida]MCO1658540.1 helix-turn-helix transcriptional regulator [Pseudonocardia humida]